jgi:hypothetical protein
MDVQRKQHTKKKIALQNTWVVRLLPLKIAITCSWISTSSRYLALAVAMVFGIVLSLSPFRLYISGESQISERK